uniref:Uncharacterized protein n=1 Tax=Anguilla anguilla TaxID=7936 RepID=A0A0E9QCK8_ANGAN
MTWREPFSVYMLFCFICELGQETLRGFGGFGYG